MTSRRSRTEILMIVIAAFRGVSGNLSESEADYGISIIETEFGGDIDAAEEALSVELQSGMKAVALAASVLG